MITCEGRWGKERYLGEDDSVVVFTCSGCGDMMVIDRYLSVGTFKKGAADQEMIDAVIAKRQKGWRG